MQETQEDLLVPSALWVWGAGSDGQAGVSKLEANLAPTAVMADRGRIECVSSGFRHTLLVRSGVVLAWGYRKHGRLGVGGSVEEVPQVEPLPVLFPATIRIASVSCGFGHSAAVSTQGELFVWGAGVDGALGLGSTEDVHVPRRTAADKGTFKAVSCGGSHTLALTHAGVMWACGTAAVLGHGLAGTTWQSWEERGEVSLICAGHKGCVVVTDDDSTGVYLFGDSEFGHLGLVSKSALEGVYVRVAEAPLRQVACGRTAAALDVDGHLYVVGANGAGWKYLASGVGCVAAGVHALLYTVNGAVVSMQVSGVELGGGARRAVSGLPPHNVRTVVAGYRTYFAVIETQLHTRNRDAFQTLRGPCKCGACPRFAALINYGVNNTDAFNCQRCGCTHTAHAEWAEVKVDPAPAPATPVPVPDEEQSSPVQERTVSSATMRAPAAAATEADHAALSLHDCKAALLQLQSRCITVRVGKPLRVFAVSDIHTDFKGNMLWLREFVAWAGDQFRNDAIIVAGDISHDMGIIETTLTLMKEAFGFVFHVCGNHECWVAPRTDTVHHAYHKMLEIQQLCVKIGVYTHAVVFDEEVAVVPMLSWYEPQFAGRSQRVAMEGFDMACRWPENDYDVTTALLALNDAAFAKLRGLRRRRTVTFSHFLPRPELYYGWPALAEVMGSSRIDKALRGVESAAHVFGHSHLNVDRVIDGVRYVQHALGSEAHQRHQSAFPHYKPKQVH